MEQLFLFEELDFCKPGKPLIFEDDLTKRLNRIYDFSRYGVSLSVEFGCYELERAAEIFFGYVF